MFKKIKPKIKLIVWMIFPTILGISLVSFILPIFKHIDLGKLNQPENNLPAQTGTAAVTDSLTAKGTGEIISAPKLQYFYVNKDTSEQLKISAKAFLVGDLNTGEVILSKNQDEVFPIASMSKLMTALITSLLITPDDTTQVSKTALATEGTNGELRLGEKIKTSDLLYPLLLESSNDAAEALAEHFNRDSFIAKMNEEASNLKMSNTSYADPSGLSPNNQSTVSDMFKLTGYLNKQKPDLLQITDKRSYSNKNHSWSNISQFLNENGYVEENPDTLILQNKQLFLFLICLLDKQVPAR